MSIKIRVLFLLVVVGVLISGCQNPTSGNSSGGDSSVAKGELSIHNASEYDIDFVHWVDDSDNVYYFESDQVYDSPLDATVGGIAVGSTATNKVEVGDSPVFFSFAHSNNGEWRTVDSYEVEQGIGVPVEISGSTMVTRIGLSSLSSDHGGMVPLSQAARAVVWASHRTNNVHNREE